MKKITAVLLIIVISAGLLINTALAAPEDQAGEEPVPSSSPYQPGVPVDSDGRALLSKVVVSGVSQSTKNPDNTMNVTVDLKNYSAKDMHDVMVGVGGLSSNTVSLTKTFGPFRTDLGAGGTGSVNFTLYVSPEIIGGNFPITLTLTYVDDSGTAVIVDRSISILVDRGIGITGSQSSVLSTPRIYVGSYSIGADKVFGGDEFELTYTLLNSGATTVKNILLTMSSDSNAYTVKTGVSNQFYIGEMAASGSYTGKITLRANNTLKSGTYNISFAIQYESMINTPYTTAALINIPMEQEQVLSIGHIKVPDAVVVGNKTLLNVSYENPGTTNIKNLVMQLSGDIPDNEKTTLIGTVKAGSTGNIDQYITPQITGSREIQISFSFEDADGNSYTTATRSVTLNVLTNQSAAPTADSNSPAVVTDGEAQTGTQQVEGLNSYWVYFIIAGAVVLAAAALIAWRFLNARKKKIPEWSRTRK